MPRWLADRVVTRLGGSHSHDRARYLSPIGMRRALHRAGFADIAFATSAGRSSLPRASMHGYFGIVARRPGRDE